MFKSIQKNDSDIVYLKLDGDKGRSFGVRPFAKGNVDKASISRESFGPRSLMPIKLIRRSMIIENNIFSQ